MHHVAATMIARNRARLPNSMHVCIQARGRMRAQAELRLFMEVCHDRNSLFFTGDTCQTIARGVGFRFEELTCMFYQVAEAQRKELEARGVAPNQVPKVSGEALTRGKGLSAQTSLYRMATAETCTPTATSHRALLHSKR
eukprot:4156080-Pleurochrysis_carterae.AAC.2